MSLKGGFHDNIKMDYFPAKQNHVYGLSNNKYYDEESGNL